MNPNATTIFIYACSYVFSIHSYDAECITQALKKRMDIVCIVLYSFICVLGAVGNGLVIFVTGFRIKKTVKTVWVFSLATADITFTFSLPLFIAHITLDYHGWAMCKLSSAILFLYIFSRIFLLVVISINRWICVRYTVWAWNHQTPQRAALVALGICILSLAAASPYICYNETKPSPRNVTWTFLSNGHMQEQGRHTYHGLTISLFVLAFVIPFIIILTSYGAIVLRLRKSPFPKSKKPFKLFTAVSVAFFVCWLPFHFISFFEIQGSEKCGLQKVSFVSNDLIHCLAFSSSCLNPILYVFLGHNNKKRWSLLSAMQNSFH
ncbi:chemerin-like receptor 1 [Hemicordylus capensis]|uniref:chemerin-like receptor 1 n=1 Tax=Hemicordylus capensis TaxID=884348 RepID=UPI002302CE8D|nr:chemerin-like receptor 1 [Hemicordylus capensis]